MNEWLRQICAVVLVEMMIIIILPDGKIGKHVKNIMPLILSLVVISPLLNFNGDTVGEIISGSNVEFEYQDDFLLNVLDSKVKNEEKQISNLLKNFGINDGHVKIEYIKKNLIDYEITRVKIDLTKSVIEDENTFIKSKEKIYEMCENYLKVDREKIDIYGN
jgi:stage III sporulation protein AF